MWYGDGGLKTALIVVSFGLLTIGNLTDEKWGFYLSLLGAVFQGTILISPGIA